MGHGDALNNNLWPGCGQRPAQKALCKDQNDVGKMLDLAENGSVEAKPSLAARAFPKICLDDAWASTDPCYLNVSLIFILDMIA